MENRENCPVLKYMGEKTQFKLNLRYETKFGNCMLELTEALKLLDAAIKRVEDTLEFQAKVKNPVEQELARRSFIREFARLGEHLIYFRGPNPERMSLGEIENMRPQFLATQPINITTDSLDKILSKDSHQGVTTYCINT